MLVSILHFEERGADLEEGIRHVLEEVVPSIQGAEGLRAAYWAVDREGGKRISVLVWDSADAQTTATSAVVEAIKQRRATAGRMSPQASPTATERFEVIAQLRLISRKSTRSPSHARLGWPSRAATSRRRRNERGVMQLRKSGDQNP